MGENLKLARIRHNLTTIQVAELANISRNTLYMLEKGNPTYLMEDFLMYCAF